MSGAIVAATSSWLYVLIAFAFGTLYALPLYLALRSSREITPEQKRRWGLTVAMTEEQRRHARRLGVLLLSSYLLFLGSVVAAALLVERDSIRIAVAGIGFAFHMVSAYALARSARKHLPQPQTPWSR